MVWIVARGQVEEYSCTLKYVESSFRVVHESRNAPIGVNGEEPRFLLSVPAKVGGYYIVLKTIRCFELFKENGCL